MQDLYLTKEYTLKGDTPKCNYNTAFVFSENGYSFINDMLNKNIELNSGSFIIMDHHNQIRSGLRKILDERNYFIEDLSYGNSENNIHINPFFAVKDKDELQTMMIEIIYALCDNEDEDLSAIVALVNALAVYVYENLPKEKRTFETFVKMIGTINMECGNDEKNTPLCDAIFGELNRFRDEAGKRYKKFIKLTGARKSEVANKVFDMFNSLSDEFIATLSASDEEFNRTLKFKTAIFINSENEEQDKLAGVYAIIMQHFLSTVEKKSDVMFIMDELPSEKIYVNLMEWLDNSRKNKVVYLVFASSLQGFAENTTTKKYFDNLKKYFYATLLTNQKDEKESVYTGRLMVKKENINEDQEVI